MGLLIIVKLKEALEIPYPIGTESLRKTWGYYVYEETKDIYLVMKVLNKYTIEETLKYIGCLEDTTVNLDKFEI